jgi:hypothetical protein
MSAKLYYLAIAVALSVPDICACFECDPAKPIWATSDKYIAWCEKNLAGQFTNVDGTDLFRIRGGILHQGHFDHPKSKFDRVMFIGPESAIKMHDIVVHVAPGVAIGGVPADQMRLSGDILQLDVIRFYGARKWAVAMANEPNVEANLPNLVRYRPNGLPPWSAGVPTIALGR